MDWCHLAANVDKKHLLWCKSAGLLMHWIDFVSLFHTHVLTGHELVEAR